MKKSLKLIKKGDKVNVLLKPGFTAGGANSYGVKITKVKTKYDENTGKPYKVIVVDEQEFRVDGEKAYPITPPWAYYITL
jgi:hypothetical protein